MPIPPNAPQVMKELHAHYCARSGYDILWNMVRENTWKEWLQYCGWSWGKNEISLVIFYLREEIGRQKRNEGALKFSNLIGDPMRFEEDLAMARRDRRLVNQVTKKPASPAPKPAPAAVPPEEAAKPDSSYFISLLNQKP